MITLLAIIVVLIPILWIVFLLLLFFKGRVGKTGTIIDDI